MGVGTDSCLRVVFSQCSCHKSFAFVTCPLFVAHLIACTSLTESWLCSSPHRCFCTAPSKDDVRNHLMSGQVGSKHATSSHDEQATRDACNPDVNELTVSFCGVGGALVDDRGTHGAHAHVVMFSRRERGECSRCACVHVVCCGRFVRFQTHAICLPPDLTFAWCARMPRDTFTLIAIVATTTSVSSHDDATMWTEGAFTFHVQDHVWNATRNVASLREREDQSCSAL